MQVEPKTLNQRKNAERKCPIEAASIRDALIYIPFYRFTRPLASSSPISMVSDFYAAYLILLPSAKCQILIFL